MGFSHYFAAPAAAPVLTERAPVTLQNAATGTGNGSTLALDDGTEDMTLAVSGGVATVEAEVSFDGGATWAAHFLRDLSVAATNLTSITAAAGAKRYLYQHLPGATHLRTRISAFVSGAITCVATERRYQ